jgi:hypothetical protein
MIELLQFIFQDFAHFLGAVVLLACLESIIKTVFQGISGGTRDS